jgi:hypothetical protein
MPQKGPEHFAQKENIAATAILIIIDVRYQLSTVFSTSLLLVNR